MSTCVIVQRCLSHRRSEQWQLSHRLHNNIDGCTDIILTVGAVIADTISLLYSNLTTHSDRLEVAFDSNMQRQCPRNGYRVT